MFNASSCFEPILEFSFSQCPISPKVQGPCHAQQLHLLVLCLSHGFPSLSVQGLRAWDPYSALGLMSPLRLASFSCMSYFYLLAFVSFLTIATGSLCFVDSNNYTFVFSSFTVPFAVTFTVTFQVPIGSDLRFACQE